jgi:hypothetical protein
VAAARKGRRNRIEGQPTITVRTRASKPDRRNAARLPVFRSLPGISRPTAPPIRVFPSSRVLFIHARDRRRHPPRVTDALRESTTRTGSTREHRDVPGALARRVSAPPAEPARVRFPRNVRHACRSPEETCITPTVWFLCRRSVPEWSLSTARCRPHMRSGARAPIEPPPRTSRSAIGPVDGFSDFTRRTSCGMHARPNVPVSNGVLMLSPQPCTGKAVR